ncbi:MAG: DUF885 domain-containing protein [Acidimicrobiales bacterium]
MVQRSSKIDQLSDDYLRRYAELSPTAAIGMGLSDPPEGLTDFGPEAQSERAQLGRDLVTAVSKESISDDRDRVAAESIKERLGVETDQHDAGEWMRELRVFGSPYHVTQGVFELLPHSSSEDWEEIASRMAHVPDALESFRTSLSLGIERGIVAAKRQALACARQTAETGEGYFTRYVAAAPDDALSEHLGVLAKAADASYLQLSEFLKTDYLKAASDVDAVGRERYTIACRRWTGIDLDFEETYAWGWDELSRIQAQMRDVSEQIAPGGGLDGAIELLETDPARSIEGIDNLIAWLQELMDGAIADLSGMHFDIPDPVKTVEARIAPPGSAAAMYYTRPSEDFSRPGRTWYPPLDKDQFPLWVEVSTAYHEGVPGHHLQLGYTTWLGDSLNSFQRHRALVSGHIEGWALYAERLMGELGYLENPDYLLGMLAAQAHRAARVIVDIGMHLELEIPSGQPYHPGETWTPELALPFMVDAGRRTEAFMASEVVRYLGWPAQAISYKVGERVWLETREKVRATEGATFDLKRFHQRAFELGLVGLGQLQRELAGD